MTVRDVVSPAFYFFMQCFGYALIAVAWGVVIFVFARGIMDLKRIFTRRGCQREIQRCAPGVVCVSEDGTRARVRRVLVFPASGVPNLRERTAAK